VTAFWVAAAFTNGDLSPFDSTALGAATAAGTAAVITAGWVYHPDGSILVAGALLALLPLAVAAASPGTSAGFLVVVLLLLAAGDVAVGAASLEIEQLWAPAVVAVGTVLVLAGMLASPGDPGRWALPSADGSGAALALAGAALLLVVAALGPARLRSVAGAGLLVGLVAAPGLSALGVIAVCGALAVVAAALVPAKPSLALGLLALAAAAYGPTRPAGILLAAGALLALAAPWDHPGWAVLGLPGAASLGASLVGVGLEGEVVALATAGLASVAAAALFGSSLLSTFSLSSMTEPPSEPQSDQALWRCAPAVVLGAWLLVAPGTWGWIEQGGTGTYDKGAAVAASVGLMAALLSRATALSRNQA
jgi:hypothetical protein